MEEEEEDEGFDEDNDADHYCLLLLLLDVDLLAAGVASWVDLDRLEQKRKPWLMMRAFSLL